jgi:hypothetical protein
MLPQILHDRVRFAMLFPTIMNTFQISVSGPPHFFHTNRTQLPLQTKIEFPSHVYFFFNISFFFFEFVHCFFTIHKFSPIDLWRKHLAIHRFPFLLEKSLQNTNAIVLLFSNTASCTEILCDWCWKLDSSP